MKKSATPVGGSSPRNKIKSSIIKYLYIQIFLYIRLLCVKCLYVYDWKIAYVSIHVTIRRRQKKNTEMRRWTACGGERILRERRVADFTPPRADRSRPYPSIDALPDQRALHTGDGTPATGYQASYQRFVTCRSGRLRGWLNPGRRRLVLTPPLCHACPACRRHRGKIRGNAKECGGGSQAVGARGASGDAWMEAMRRWLKSRRRKSGCIARALFVAPPRFPARPVSLEHTSPRPRVSNWPTRRSVR